ncbi:sugar porter family MFS transporter [Sphingobacterium paludis]|uniref:SP family arabinose:H+ symporter-like MFS transporter n=1 Tax=Sphingobacterium paludis TaxID=1476465 RepID=A0A4R7CVP9_9SPHI|nr:sugar porter family MFS transporter [Sphingobacterium paludis]TDS11937.1 SP family arabinose:H+ symporter-like MFS transporter [Sphingobacterium paludis]
MIHQKPIPLLFITLIASLGGLLFGFDMAVISGVLPLVKQQFSLTAGEEGWFVSSALLGCIIGVVCSGEMSDRWGRKKPLFLAASLFIVSALGCALAPDLASVIVFRILGGVGIGIASSVVPLYISEIAPADRRGRLVTYYQFAVTLGILLAYLSNAALLGDRVIAQLPIWSESKFVSELWRLMLGIGVLPAILFFVGLLFVPESPRWLLQHKKIKDLKSAAEKSGRDPSLTNTSVDAMSAEAGIGGHYKDLFAPPMRKALLIGILLPVFSQFSGINAIIYYGPTILGNAGISLSNSLLSQIIFGAANMFFTLFAIWKVDQWGRRPLYLWGTAGAAVSLLATGFCFYIGAVSSVWLLLCVLLFLACFACSIGPLKFVVASEIFPSAIRGRALALSVTIMWVADTAVGQITPILLHKLGNAGTFWVFALFCVAAFVMVYRLLPETKGKSLEEIEADWKSTAGRRH